MSRTPFSITDTHTHIYYNVHNQNMREQIARCIENSVERLFLPNVDIESISLVMDTVKAYPNMCFPMLGLHPCSVKENYLEELNIIEKAISRHKIYAIGEIGLDLYWDKSTLQIQKEAFRIQVSWAKSLDLPIVIHCREAFDELFVLLEELKDEKLYGILHCFTGNLEQAKRAIELGFYLGIGGVVTYKKSGLDTVLSQISLDHIVLETDAPYLAPTPFRGKENESSYIIHVAQKISEIYQLDIAEIANITTANSKRIFRI